MLYLLLLFAFHILFIFIWLLLFCRAQYLWSIRYRRCYAFSVSWFEQIFFFLSRFSYALLEPTIIVHCVGHWAVSVVCAEHKAPSIFFEFYWANLPIEQNGLRECLFWLHEAKANVSLANCFRKQHSTPTELHIFHRRYCSDFIWIVNGRPI